MKSALIGMLVSLSLVFFPTSPIPAQENKTVIKSEKEIKVLLEEIEREREKLLEREEYVKREEERLEILKMEVVKKIEEMQKLLKKLEALFGKLSEKERKEVERLTKIFETMKPDKAGPIFERLETKIAARILLGMDERKAGKILSYVSPEKSVEITEEVTKLKKSLKRIIGNATSETP